MKKSCTIRVFAMLLVISMLLPMAGCKSGSKMPRVKDAADAISVLKDIGDDYGYENALSELTEKSASTVDGDSYYRLQQNYSGIPVYGRTVVCFTDGKGNVVSVTGNATDINTDLDLTPTATKEEIRNAIQEHFLREFDSNEVIPEFDLYEQNLCIYSLGNDSKHHLAYCLHIGMYEIIVDAHSAYVLHCSPIVYEDAVTCYNADGSEQFSGYQAEDGTYVLCDTERNLYIFDAANKTYWNQAESTVTPDVLTLVTSNDPYFGNNDDTSSSPEVTYKVLKALARIYDYFDVNFNDRGCGVVVGICNDKIGAYNGKNAGASIYEISTCLGAELPGYNSASSKGLAGFIMIGTAYCQDIFSSLETLGHEYMHYITRNQVGWLRSISGNSETDAIDEGISDIFGEIIDGTIGNGIDWIHGDRTISDPSKNEYPEAVGEKELNILGYISVRNSDGERKYTDYAHGYSTVISHSAYLMWNGIDGNPGKKINVDNLAKLWYRAMLMMPSDCDFQECRRLVELTARSMDLTEAQVDCVAEAFNKVGIAKKTSYDEISENAALLLTGTNGELYGNYTLYIKPVEIQKEAVYLLNKDTASIKKSCQDIREISSAEPYALNLQKGVYAIAFEDNADESKSFVRLFWVTKDGADAITVETNFGIKRLVQINTYYGTTKYTTYLHYDEIGLLKKVVDESGEYHYDYDDQKRLIKIEEGDIKDFYSYHLLELSYDSNSHISSWNMFSPMYGDYYGKCIYDDQDRMIFAETSWHTIEISYDEDGNAIETITENSERAEVHTPVTRKKLYIDEEKRLSRDVELSPDVEIVHESYEYGIANEYNYYYFPYMVIEGKNYFSLRLYPNPEFFGMGYISSACGSLYLTLIDSIYLPMRLWWTNSIDDFDIDVDEQGYLISIMGRDLSSSEEVRCEFIYTNG